MEWNGMDECHLGDVSFLPAAETPVYADRLGWLQLGEGPNDRATKNAETSSNMRLHLHIPQWVTKILHLNRFMTTSFVRGDLSAVPALALALTQDLPANMMSIKFLRIRSI